MTVFNFRRKSVLKLWLQSCGKPPHTTDTTDLRIGRYTRRKGKKRWQPDSSRDK